jgi:mannosyltransferase OCH1-like enzyme
MRNESYISRNIFTGVPSLELINEELAKNFNKIQSLNSDWAHKIFTNDMQRDYMEKYYKGRVFDAYMSIQAKFGAARSDLFKYCLIYREGGIWLDAKSTCNRGFDEIIQHNDKYLLSHWPGLTTGAANELFWAERCQIPCYEFINWVIISEKGHPFLKNVINLVVGNIETYNPFKHGISAQAVLGTTGPLAYTNAIFSNLNTAEFRKITAHEEGIYYSIFQGMEHRNIIKSNYSELNSPLISNGILMDSLSHLAAIRMIYLRVKRKISRIIQNILS